MREVKFRAWDIIRKGMIDLNKEMVSIPYYELFCHTPDSRVMELMQYTGLKDSKGVEIYEGDVLKSLFDGDLDPVLVVAFTEQSYNIPMCIKDSKRIPHCEVIGNIHSNPELVKEIK